MVGQPPQLTSFSVLGTGNAFLHPNEERQDHDRTKTDDGLYVVFQMPSDEQLKLLAKSFAPSLQVFWVIIQ